jgi:hypothetical protein
VGRHCECSFRCPARDTAATEAQIGVTQSAAAATDTQIEVSQSADAATEAQIEFMAAVNRQIGTSLASLQSSVDIRPMRLSPAVVCNIRLELSLILARTIACILSAHRLYLGCLRASLA